MTDNVVERDALYYPYVHFPSEAWLKASLLFSPHVYRMVAHGYEPRWDTDFMRRIRRVEVDRVPLLEHADLWSPTAQDAQHHLLERLQSDIAERGPAFKARFERPAARKLAQDGPGFQMHPDKLAYRMIGPLMDLGLAWRPSHPDDHEYVELHPAIGSVFLGSIAMACAADRGLAVVGDADDPASRGLNRLASTRDFNAVYDEFVLDRKPPRELQGGSGQRVADIILVNHCDASQITVEDLVDLASEREPIIRLKARLQELAAQIPEMLDEQHLETRLQACAEKALAEWQADRASFRGALKKFFGGDLVKAATDLLKGSINKSVDAGSAAPGVAMGLAASHFLGPLGGFGVAVVVHGATSMASEAAREKRSPYRYLSKAEKAGVVFSVGGRPSED